MRTNRERLLQKLEAVSPGLTQKEVIEQSTCFVFQDGKVATFNDEIACVCEVDLKITGAVQASPLLSLLGKMVEDDIDVDVTDGEFYIKGKRRRAGIRMEQEVVLPIDSVDAPKKWKDLHEDFVEAVGIVQQCASRDESQFCLTCIHLHSDWVEACDNFQASRYPLSTGIVGSVLMRRDSIRHIAGLDMTEFSETKSWIHFRNPSGLVLSCRRHLEEYPDISKVFDVSGRKTVLPGGLAEAVEKAEIFSSESIETEQVSVELKDGRLRLEGRGPSGWYREQKQVSYEGDPMKFCIEPNLLLEITKRTNECEIAEGKLKVDGGKFVYIVCTVNEED